MGVAAALAKGWRNDGGALVSFYAAMAKAASRLVEQYGMEARWYSQEAVSPSCSVTLEASQADLFSGFGVTAMENIDGHDASTADTEGRRIAHTAAFTVDWEGSRSIEFVVNSASESGDVAVFFDDGGSPNLFAQLSAEATLAAGDRITVIAEPDSVTPTDQRVRIKRNGTEVVSSVGGTVGTTELYIGLFNFPTNDGTPVGSISFTAFPAADDLVSGEGDDWCGNSTGGSGFDPVTGKNTSVSDVPHLVQSVLVETDVSLVDGSRIESGRKVILMDGAQTPTTGWKLDADYTDGVPAAGSFPGAISGGVRGRWTVVEVKEINPAGIPLLYELQVMQ